MHMRNIVKILAWCTAALVLAAVVSACSGEDQNSQASPAPSASASQSPSQPAADGQTETEFLHGTYNGLIDGHTVEIETAEGPQAYQISPEIAEKASEWEPGSKVKYRAEDNTITEMELE